MITKPKVSAGLPRGDDQIRKVLFHKPGPVEFEGVTMVRETRTPFEAYGEVIRVVSGGRPRSVGREYGKKLFVGQKMVKPFTNTINTRTPIPPGWDGFTLRQVNHDVTREEP